MSFRLYKSRPSLYFVFLGGSNDPMVDARSIWGCEWLCEEPRKGKIPVKDGMCPSLPCQVTPAQAAINYIRIPYKALSFRTRSDTTCKRIAIRWCVPIEAFSALKFILRR